MRLIDDPDVKDVLSVRNLCDPCLNWRSERFALWKLAEQLDLLRQVIQNAIKPMLDMRLATKSGKARLDTIYHLSEEPAERWICYYLLLNFG